MDADGGDRNGSEQQAGHEDEHDPAVDDAPDQLTDAALHDRPGGWADDRPGPVKAHTSAGDGGREAAADDETAVRRYLAWIDDPGTLADPLEIARLEAAVEAASAGRDPIERLLALSALDRARRGDPDACRQAFISVARSWAERRGVTVAAFQSMGVNDITLVEAGFELGRGAPAHRPASRPGGPARTRRGDDEVTAGGGRGPVRPGRPGRVAVDRPAATAPDRQRAVAVPMSLLKDHVRSRSGPFTLADVQADAGGSDATVRKAVEEMVSTGEVVRVGTDPHRHERGRAPMRYRLA